MASADLLTQIQSSGLAHLISKSNHMVGASLQVFHIFGFILLLSALTIVSLRIFGLVFAQQPLAKVARDGTRLIWIGLAVAVTSGTLMFISGARHYGHNWAFELKMVLLLAAVIVQVALFRRVVAAESFNPALARASAALSLLVWFSVGLAGRMIGFI
jgi:hypothetical protein